MHKFTLRNKKRNGLISLILILLFPNLKINAQSVTTPQVNFSQRSSTATPSTKIYNIKGDFTMLGNTNLSLSAYDEKKNNEGNDMKYVDIDGDPTTLNSSMATLELSNAGENGTNQSCSKVLFAGLYWTGKSDDTKENFSVTKNSVTKNYTKNSVSLKGPGTSVYTKITATTNSSISAIRFPGTAQSGIFVGYQEVTDYVREHGSGAYTVADMALKEGINSNPGYSGGWVMIVIYENPTMKPRAVTLFDGYAYVDGQKTENNTRVGEYGNISISGFTTVGSGPVNMKLGVMAAEGDVGTATGRTDYLSVLKLTSDSNSYPGNYQMLNHAGNQTGNFFNSSIFPKPVTGMSNPILTNNTGVDFSMFTIPNPGNSVIGNNQTSTNFRFGSNYDVYTIFGFAMSVDAYIPEPQGIIKINSIGGTASPSPLIASPGDDIEYQIDIRNRGSESTKNSIITIPIPFSTLYTIESIVTTIIDNSFLPTNAPVFDSNSNSIVWNIGNIPLANPNTLLASLVFKVKLTTDCATLFNAGCNSNISLNGTISGAGAVSNNPFTVPISQGIDPNSSCGGLIDKPILVNFNSSNSPCFASLAGADTSSSMCGLSSVVLNATVGTHGTWSIFNGPTGGGEVFSNKNSPTTEFSTPNAGIYTLRWTIPYGNGTCTPIFDDVQVSTELCNKLDFDGIDDNVNFGNNYNLDSGSFSIEVWVKPSVSNGNIQSIFSKRSSVALEDGYDLRIVNNIVSFNWNKGNSITSKFPISTGRWYHVAVTFNGTAYNLFIDGIKVENEVSGYNPMANNNTKSILGAMIQNTSYPHLPTNFFNGWMQELRIWNVALTESQMHQMMNQKIKNNESSVLGLTVPQIIPGINWGNLEGYYQMVQSSDIVNGHLIDKSNNVRNGKLIGIITQQPETAPLPYTSLTDNAWENSATWSHGAIWNIPNTLGVDDKTYIDWNIVKTNHNILTTGNKTVLGLLVENNTITTSNDTKIEVSHYLKLDGKIDLQGMSQLLQTTNSDLDPTSKGSIERDQQGQLNKYNYNYWSSPVSPINPIANNSNYTVKGVMKDGTTSTPIDIKFIDGYDGTTTPTLSLARYWLNKFESNTDAYANWIQFTENDDLKVGQGFTLKGAGAIGGATLNYTFAGKPNNGKITNYVGPNQLLLIGNPYPSALDAYKFLDDNLAVNQSTTDGTLYFWQHAPENNTHILANYLGSYGVLNRAGGVPAMVTPDLITGGGTSSRRPNRYIPVGQGFFVYGTPSGGAVEFNNSQRAFFKENDGLSNSLFRKKELSKVVRTQEHVEETYKKIRLGYNTINGYHRQVLLAFMDDKATNALDYGYDSEIMDDFPNDMYLLSSEAELAIQGEGYFDENASFPIGVRIEKAGKVSFGIDAVENFDTNQAVYIYDAETDMHHAINDALFEIELEKGIVNDRFSLRFTDKTLGIKNTTFEDAIAIHYTQSSKILTIANNMKDNTVETASLYDMQGKAIANWKVTDKEQTNIKIQVQSMSSGVYIVKLKTVKGNISKKIIVR